MTAFWVDHDYDRDSASDGVSRYRAYLRQYRDDIDEALSEDGPARFAVEAWRVANSPIMAPGYVRSHPRILSARVAFNAWDGTLTGRISLVTPWPSILQGAREWRAGARWFDWPTIYTPGDGDLYCDPSEQDLTRNSFLMASAEMAFPIPTIGLRWPLADPVDVLSAAQDAVSILVSQLNHVVDPVLNALERS